MTSGGNPQSLILRVLNISVVGVAYVCAPNGCSVRWKSCGGVEFGPVVFVAALWSRIGSVQPLRTDPLR